MIILASTQKGGGSNKMGERERERERERKIAE